MNIDVAVRQSVLAAAIHNRVSAIPICAGESLTGFLDGMVVDRVEIDPPTLSRSNVQLPVQLANGSQALVWAHKLRATLVVRVQVATQAALEQAGPNVPDTIPLQFQVRFDLFGELDLDDDNNVIGAGVRTTYAGKDATLPDPDLDALVDSLLSAAGQFAPIDLSALTDALGSGGAIRNFGLALDGNRVVIRLEIGSVAPNPASAWASFYSSPPDWLGSRDWAIFVDQALICQAVEARIGEELVKSENDGTIEVLEQPNASWLGWMGAPLVQVQTYIDAVEACPNGLDIGVDVTATTVLSLVPGPALGLSTEITWDLVDSDVLLCGITMGLFGATLGAVLGGGGGPIGAVIGAVIGMVGSIVAIATIADTVSPPSMATADCQQTESDDDHVVLVCNQPLELASNPLLGDLAPDELAANATGLLFRGSSDVPAMNTDLFVVVEPFAWTSHLNCNTKNVDHSLSGGATFACVAAAPLVGCGAEVLEDPLDYFNASLKVVYTQMLELVITMDAAKSADYQADPYPCRVLVHTSRGARIVDLGTIPDPPAAPDQLELLAAIASLCLKAIDPKAKIHALWRLWLPDPPPDEWATLQRWDVAIANAAPGTVISLLDAAGTTFDELTVGPQGTGRLRLVQVPAGKAEENGLSIQVTLPEEAETRREASELPNLSIGQTQLVRSRLLSLPAPAQAMARIGLARPMLGVVAGDWLATFGQQPVAGVAATAQLLLPGIRGVFGDAMGVVAFGDFGLRRFTVAGDGSLTFAGRWRLDEAGGAGVRDAISIGDLTAVLTEDRLVLLRAGQRPRVIAAEPDAVLASWGGRLGVLSASRGEVALYELRDGLPSRPVVTVPVPARAVPLDIGRRTARAVDRLVFSLHAGDTGWSAPEVRARAAAWYDTAVAVGPWLARLERDGQVGLWRAGSPVAAQAPFGR